MDYEKKRGLVLSAGESIHIPVGVPHRYFNAGERPATFHFRADPGYRYEMGIRAATAMANAGRTNAHSIPKNPLEAALLFELAGTYPAGIPIRLQQILGSAVGKLARWRGHDPTFAAYLDEW